MTWILNHKSYFSELQLKWLTHSKSNLLFTTTYTTIHQRLQLQEEWGKSQQHKLYLSFSQILTQIYIYKKHGNNTLYHQIINNSVTLKRRFALQFNIDLLVESTSLISKRKPSSREIFNDS